MALTTSSQTTNSNKNSGIGILSILLGVLITVFLGVFIAFGSPVLLAIFLSLIIGCICIAIPKMAVWVAVVGSIVLSGVTELYFPQFQQIRWAVSLLSMALIVISLGAGALSRRDEKISYESKITLVMVLLLFASVALSLIANPSVLKNSIIGMKNYFQMYGVLLSLAFFKYSAENAKRFMQFLFVLSLVQLPFALQQFIYYVPLRDTVLAAQHNIVAIDIVAGTFGGNLYGGGRSSTLALLQSIAILIVLLKWTVKENKTALTLFYGFWIFIPMALNEAKLFIVLIPLGLFIAFRKEILAHPIKTLISIIVMVSLLLALLFVYSLLPGQQFTSFESFMNESIAYNMGDKGYGSAVLNRTTVYSFWWSQNISHGDILHSLFGHGLGQTNSAGVNVDHNLANTIYAKYAIGLTGTSAMLWEVGLVGTAVFFMFLFFAFRLGTALVNTWAGSSQWPYLKAAQASIVMFAISMFHNNYLVTDIGTQALMMVVVGYLLAMSRIKFR